MRFVVVFGLLFLPLRAQAQQYQKEDWLVTFEPLHNKYWGINWAVNNYMLPYRIVHRGKHSLENKWTQNWNFGDTPGGALSVAGRAIFGTFADYALFMGGQLLHHAAGHDAAAREFTREYGFGTAPSRYRDILPYFLGGSELEVTERQIESGADAATILMTQPMTAENIFAYEAGIELLAKGQVNTLELENYVFYRLRFLNDAIEEQGSLSQEYLDSGRNGVTILTRSSGKMSTDFTNYLYTLNTDRYGVTSVDNYKIAMADVGMAYAIQLLDPMFLFGLWKLGDDHIVHGRLQSEIPMLQLKEDLAWLPSLRVFFSPFGIEYYQDNYFKTENLTADIYWAMGDNRYEDRYGLGVDIRGLSLSRGIKAGLFCHLTQQPLLSRLSNKSALTSNELNDNHFVYSIGGSIHAPVAGLGEYFDNSQPFLYARGGIKNEGWVPGDYLAAGPYLQTGLGLTW